MLIQYTEMCIVIGLHSIPLAQVVPGPVQPYSAEAWPKTPFPLLTVVCNTRAYEFHSAL